MGRCLQKREGPTFIGPSSVDEILYRLSGCTLLR